MRSRDYISFCKQSHGPQSHDPLWTMRLQKGVRDIIAGLLETYYLEIRYSWWVWNLNLYVISLYTLRWFPPINVSVKQYYIKCMYVVFLKSTQTHANKQMTSEFFAHGIKKNAIDNSRSKRFLPQQASKVTLDMINRMETTFTSL